MPSPNCPRSFRKLYTTYLSLAKLIQGSILLPSCTSVQFTVPGNQALTKMQILFLIFTDRQSKTKSGISKDNQSPAGRKGREGKGGGEEREERDGSKMKDRREGGEKKGGRKGRERKGVIEVYKKGDRKPRLGQEHEEASAWPDLPYTGNYSYN